VIASCPKLVQIPYKHQHEPKLSIRKLVKEHLLEEPYSSYYKDELQVILENDKYKLCWNHTLLKDKTVPFN
jgi:hypothetical protein